MNLTHMQVMHGGSIFFYVFSIFANDTTFIFAAG